MILSIRTGGAVVCALAISAAYAQTRPADSAVPHLEKRGLATQLIVDGKPFLILGAEPPTSGPSNLVYLRYMLQVQADTHQNTAAIAVGWNWGDSEDAAVPRILPKKAGKKRQLRMPRNGHAPSHGGTRYIMPADMLSHSVVGSKKPGRLSHFLRPSRS